MIRDEDRDPFWGHMPVVILSQNDWIFSQVRNNIVPCSAEKNLKKRIIFCRDFVVHMYMFFVTVNSEDKRIWNRLTA